MKITIDNEYHNIPLTDLDTVIFSHNKTVITIPLLAKLVENNVNVIICGRKNDPIGVFQGFNTHSLVFKKFIKVLWNFYAWGIDSTLEFVYYHIVFVGQDEALWSAFHLFSFLQDYDCHLITVLAPYKE